MSPEAVGQGRSRHTLLRTLEKRHVALIGLGGVIGAGLFVGSSASIAAAGPAIVVSYILAGALLFLVMKMLAEMAANRPEIRAFTDFIRSSLGPGTGFVIGWTYWYLWTLVISIEAIAGGSLLQPVVGLSMPLIALLLVGLMTAINLLSTRMFGEVEFWFASIKVVAIVAFIAFGALYALGLHPQETLRNLTGYGGFAPRGVSSVAAGVVTVFFSLTGAEIVTVASAEAKADATTIAGISRTLVIRILAFYVISIFLIVAILPWSSVVPGSSPYAQTLSAMGAPVAGKLMNAVILTAVLSCLNTAFYISSRVIFTLSTHHDAPRWLTQVNRRGVPTRTVLVAAAVGTLCLGLAVIAPKTIFEFLINTTGALILLMYFAICFAYLKFRRASRSSSSSWRLAPFPGVVYVAIASIAIVLAAMTFYSRLTSQMYASVVPLIVATVGYRLSKRRRESAGRQPSGGEQAVRASSE